MRKDLRKKEDAYDELAKRLKELEKAMEDNLRRAERAEGKLQDEADKNYPDVIKEHEKKVKRLEELLDSERLKGTGDSDRDKLTAHIVALEKELEVKKERMKGMEDRLRDLAGAEREAKELDK